MHLRLAPWLGKLAYEEGSTKRENGRSAKQALTTSTTCSFREGAAFVKKMSASGAEREMRDGFSENK